MKFLSKAELRFLIKHEERISKRLKNDLIEYCSINSINLNKRSISNDEWNNGYTRIETKRESNRLRIVKLESAKKADIRSKIVIIVMLTILFVGVIYISITQGLEDPGAVLTLLFTPLLIFMIIEILKKVKQRKIEFSEDRRIEIEGEVCHFIRDGEEVVNGKLSNIYYYWQEGTEAGEDPSVTLDIKLKSGKYIRVDEEGDYKELLFLADEIAGKTGANLLFLDKDAPIKCSLEL